MWFIINRFISNAVRDYSLEFVTNYTNGGKQCDMYIKRLDPELKDIILATVYYPIIGYSDRCTSRGESISRDPIYGTRSIASSIGCDDTSVYISMNESTYGELINRLDAEIRRYYANRYSALIINCKE